MITDLPGKRIFKCYHSGKNISKSFYLQNGGKTSADMEQNYVSVTLCISIWNGNKNKLRRGKVPTEPRLGRVTYWRRKPKISPDEDN